MVGDHHVYEKDRQ
jgi:hypothetical protein